MILTMDGTSFASAQLHMSLDKFIAAAFQHYSSFTQITACS